MMKKASFDIIDLSMMAGDILKSESKQEGIDPQSSLAIGMASGLDVGLTLLEQSTGVLFKGLTTDKAIMVSHYFREEADRAEKIHKQIAIWYRAWAEVLEQLYAK
jgi:hypothetical protein